MIMKLAAYSLVKDRLIISSISYPLSFKAPLAQYVVFHADVMLQATMSTTIKVCKDTRHQLSKKLH